MLNLRRFSFIRKHVPVALICLSLVLGSVFVTPAAARDTQKPTAADLDAAFAAQWMQLVYDHVQAETVSAPDASRVYAYAGVALYEAVVPAIPGDVSLATQIKGMPAMPASDPSLVYDWPTVANGALTIVVNGLLAKDTTHQAVATLHDQQLADRKKSAADDIITRSLSQGEAVGNALLAWAAQDNFKDVHGKPYKLPAGGTWDYTITTPGTVPVEPYWGSMRPFALDKSTMCDVPLNIELSSDPSSTLYAQAMEVKTVHDNLTDEQKAIANFWVDTPGLTGAPSGHWVSIENQMIGRLNLKLDRAAEMYALIGMTLADSFIACWGLKYEAPYLRPVTYIDRYISHTWQPYILTPPFPTYPSGHSVASAAAAEVLTSLFGTVAYTDTTHVGRGLPARSFTSFEAAADEAAISRLYGGIHFRVDIENGVKQGRCVAQTLINNIHLHTAKTS